MDYAPIHIDFSEQGVHAARDITTLSPEEQYYQIGRIILGDINVSGLCTTHQVTLTHVTAYTLISVERETNETMRASFGGLLTRGSQGGMRMNDTSTSVPTRDQPDASHVRPEVMANVKQSLKDNAAVWAELAKY